MYGLMERHVPKSYTHSNSTMADAVDVRVIGLEVKKNTQSLKDRVDGLKTEVDAIHAVTDTWVLNSDDGSLPTEAAVKAQEAAYNALNSAVTKPSTSLSDSLEAIRAVE